MSFNLEAVNSERKRIISCQVPEELIGAYYLRN